MKRILNRRQLRTHKKKGSIAFPTLLFAGAIFIAGMFFMVEMPLKLIMSNQMVDTVNNAAASGVTQIVEERVRYGELKIDEDRAREVVEDVFTRTYDLDHNLQPIEPDEGANKLAKVNEINVQVANRPLHASDSWTHTFVVPQTQEEIIRGDEPIEVTVRESSVFVYANMTFKRPIRVGDDQLTLQRFAISEVSFPEYQ